ncbi:hypothetical protein DUNSADRAFT_6750 [Dunaliella salina]|uniref:Uncharacterized protein n=1 Tax=Dunaliella salina TaxID=3046 RepID=A0ABQ7H6M7_DUNSA|nr:hypothetical protein DUNSADRAFT_6750 [Dunaliella salina]|eukprot:KAF5842506.1 hypothetical protein DUNSADRAFT_6750 [Dunaliella salina]
MCDHLGNLCVLAARLRLVQAHSQCPPSSQHPTLQQQRGTEVRLKEAGWQLSLPLAPSLCWCWPASCYPTAAGAAPGAPAHLCLGGGAAACLGGAGHPAALSGVGGGAAAGGALHQPPCLIPAQLPLPAAAAAAAPAAAADLHLLAEPEGPHCPALVAPPPSAAIPSSQGTRPPL